MSLHRLHVAGAELVVDDVGAVIHGCRFGDVWALPHTDGHAERASGEQLFPWPNRLRNGQWVDAGSVRQLPLTEPEHSNAIHGLLRDVRFEVQAGPGWLELTGTLEARAGYPWTIECAFRFELSASTLAVTASFSNTSQRPAPWAYGAHPYLSLPGPATFELAADRVWLVDEQLIPTHAAPVADAFDLRNTRELGSFSVDHAFERTDPGAHTLARLRNATAELSLWADDQFGFVQVYTPPAGRLHQGGTAIAVEPMTALADCFNSGIGLRQLTETVSLRWGVTMQRR